MRVTFDIVQPHDAARERRQLRQCALDGQHILNCGADTSVPQVSVGGAEEQAKAELLQYALHSNILFAHMLT